MKSLNLELDSGKTVEDLKNEIIAKMKNTVEIDQLKIIYDGKELTNDQKLDASFDEKKMSCVIKNYENIAKRRKYPSFEYSGLSPENQSSNSTPKINDETASLTFNKK